MNKAGRILLYLFLIIVGCYFAFLGLVAAQGFLAPLVIAILLAMVVLPVAGKLEQWGMGRGLASFIADLVLMIATLGFVFVLAAQVSLVVGDWDEITDKLEPKVDSAVQYVERKGGFSLDKMFTMPSFLQSDTDSTNSAKQDTTLANQQQGASASTSQASPFGSFSGRNILTGAASSAMTFFGFLGTLILVFIYVFFLLLYRNKLRKSLLRMVSDDQKERTNQIIAKSITVAKGYLAGRFILIIILSVFYIVGFLLLGVQYAIFVGIIAAVLSIIPYFGNIIGGAIALLFALVSGGGIGTLIGVVAVFVVSQFLENNLLVPYVIGKKVELNPIVIIIIVILGGAVWGVAGMILAIPITGIFKVVFDAIPVMEPLGYLLGNEGIGGDGEGVMKKLKKKIKNIFS
ncbi:MAG: AI-2E family transporter [Clostridia bacterium]|nr:AI-2E family transporter [Clostridia bacterium]